MPAILFVVTLVILLCGAASAEPVDVYLLAGQSNATGQGYLANLPQGFAPNAKVLLFHSGGHLNSGAQPNTWIPLRQASESPDRFGPELGFGNRMQDLQTQRRVAIIKHAFSGTNLYHDWAPGKDAADIEHFGPQFKTFVDTVNAGMKALADQGYHAAIRGMLWQQGEGDADGQPADDYGANLARFIARVREQFGVPDMVFVYGYVLPPPCAGVGRDKVRAWEKQIDQDSGSPMAVKGALVVATDDLSQRADDPNTPYKDDHVHFGTAGTLELGRRMADKMNAQMPRRARGRGPGSQ